MSMPNISYFAINCSVSQSTETGLIYKTVKTGIFLAYDMMGDKNFVFELRKPSYQMELDEIKIVLGPYIFGVCSAFLSLLWEYSRSLKDVYNQ